MKRSSMKLCSQVFVEVWTDVQLGGGTLLYSERELNTGEVYPIGDIALTKEQKFP
ncbi:uncharacterized protein PHALS_08196 [Plasmopara halstedii]|uniref:Uncharacterized protein n=1 Tax=Plasmopara halstedii TaxID=4781 RepID=A0A0P1ABA0_PLAHL|nr:uncharacterized protein PHALS_08196 [Plasmopara halstedii]CEG38102.1 hypothetical protein PHALS_08196 [Plasmopara halstedii]|eukprot:XP_024574471.1 hypothetical protein PHALS_08196 [Plasmopara halstedii]